MEAFRRSALYLCSVLLILTDVCSKYIHIPSEVRSGMEGSPMLLSVETNFSLDEAKIQGTWSHIKLSGTSTPLITFTNNEEITDMTYDNRLLFQRSNFSLLIQKLKQDDEGQYHLDLNIKFHNRKDNLIQAKGTVHLLVHVPVSTPLIEKSPLQPVIEDKANVTWTCSVERGTRVWFQWLKDDVTLTPSKRYKFSKDNSTLLISPVRKEDKGTYRCVASNIVSKRQYSRAVELNVYYGPYNLEVNSRQSLWTSGVFTINPGELVFFECQADSNPPNSYVWISKNHNRTEIITEGPRLEVQRYTLAQAEEYLCRAFNNMTQKQDETQFTLVVAKFKTERDKQTQDGASWSPLAVILVCASFFIGCMLLFFIRRTCHPKRVLMSVYKRPFIDQHRPHRSGHEDASEDFGIYEFVSIPGKMESTQASCRSLARLESIQDMHTTIYDVIRHVPESPSQSLLN